MIRERPPLPWYRRWWFYLTILVVGTALGLVVWSAVRDWQAQRDLDIRLAELDQAEPNWRLEDWYRGLSNVPEEENLALVALALQKGYKSEGQTFIDLFGSRDQYPGNPLNAEQVKELRGILAGVGDLRAGTERLLRLKVGHFPPPVFSDSAFKMLTFGVPAQQRLRGTVNLLDYQADLWAQEGRGDDALLACRGMLHVAHSCDDDPFLISQLIGYAMRGASVTTLERALARTEPGDAALAAAQEAFWAEAGRSAFARVVRGERATMDRFLLEVQQGRYSRVELTKMLAIPSSRFTSGGFSVQEIWDRSREALRGSPFGFLPRERLEALRFSDEALAALQGPEGAVEAGLKEVGERYRERSAAVAIFGPAFHKVYGADCKARAMTRAAATILAAERYRRANGKLPASWDDLVPKYLPAVPIDSYDGKPLRWKKTDTGLMIYSVWMNKVDDGGHIRPNDEGGRDCGVELWDAKHRGKLPAIPLPKKDGE